jgi:hypothetical protein
VVCGSNPKAPDLYGGAGRDERHTPVGRRIRMKSVEVEMSDHSLGIYLERRLWDGPDKGCVHINPKDSRECVTVYLDHKAVPIAVVWYDNEKSTRKVFLIGGSK